MSAMNSAEIPWNVAGRGTRVAPCSAWDSKRAKLELPAPAAEALTLIRHGQSLWGMQPMLFPGLQ